jgi:hypothetical protein
VEVPNSSGDFRAFPITINQNREIWKANHIVHIAFFLGSLNKAKKITCCRKKKTENLVSKLCATFYENAIFWLERTDGHDSHANPLPQAMKGHWRIIFETIWLLETSFFARPLVI